MSNCLEGEIVSHFSNIILLIIPGRKSFQDSQLTHNSQGITQYFPWELCVLLKSFFPKLAQTKQTARPKKNIEMSSKKKDRNIWIKQWMEYNKISFGESKHMYRWHIDGTDVCLNCWLLVTGKYIAFLVHLW